LYTGRLLLWQGGTDSNRGSFHNDGHFCRRQEGKGNVAENDISVLLARLDRIEAALDLLVRQRTIRDWYSTEEAAKILGRSEYTLREWCRTGRIRAEKKGSGRGKYRSWVISHEELQRVQREGLFPPADR
jgi:excisionase family DNA binding protein